MIEDNTTLHDRLNAAFDNALVSELSIKKLKQLMTPEQIAATKDIIGRSLKCYIISGATKSNISSSNSNNSWEIEVVGDSIYRSKIVSYGQSYPDSVDTEIVWLTDPPPEIIMLEALE